MATKKKPAVKKVVKSDFEKDLDRKINRAKERVYQQIKISATAALEEISAMAAQVTG